MNRRSFLLSTTVASLMACTASSAPDEGEAGLRDAPVRLEAYLIDAQTPFRDTGQPYLNALSRAGIDRPADIDWIVLPDYGRETGAHVGGAMMAAADEREVLETFFSGLPSSWQLPETHELRYGHDRRPDESGPPRWGARVVRVPPVFETSHIIRVEAQDDAVTLWIDRVGANRLEIDSARNVGQRLAIVVDDEVVSDPIINEAIPGGRVQITMGDADSDDYRDLAQRFMG